MTMLKLFWLNNFYVRCSIIWHSFCSDAQIWPEQSENLTHIQRRWNIERSENLTHIQRRWNIPWAKRKFDTRSATMKYYIAWKIWQRLPNMTSLAKYDIAWKIWHRLPNMTLYYTILIYAIRTEKWLFREVWRERDRERQRETERDRQRETERDKERGRVSAHKSTPPIISSMSHSTKVIITDWSVAC